MYREEAALEHSGIVPSHKQAMLQTASQNNCIIMVRPVNKLSTDLISEGYATKDLHVKGKSSDWGPQAGFICCDQKFSKLAKKKPQDISKFNSKVKESIQGNYAKQVPLLISEGRLKSLIKTRMIHVISQKNGGYHITNHGAPHQEFLLYPNVQMPSGDYPKIYQKHHKTVITMFKQLPLLKHGYWVLVKEKDAVEEMLVLAEFDSGVPLTADYDLFCVAPHLSNFSDEKSTGFKSVATKVLTALATKERRDADADLGRISSLTRLVKDQINNKIGVKKVVHHGCEVDNPVTELDYPVTAFTPWNEVIAASNQSELEAMIRDIIRLGYAFYANRLWSQAGVINSNSRDVGYARDYNWNTNISTDNLSTLEVFVPRSA